MKLPESLVKAFVTATNDKTKEESNKILHGTITTVTEDRTLVTLDGSDVETPVVKMCEGSTGDRVMVELKNRKAYLVGNLSHPVTRVTGDDIISVVEQEYGEINLALYTKKDEIIADINLSTETDTGGGVVRIDAAKINLNGAVSMNNNVVIDTFGKLSCVDASIQGSITSSTYSNGKCNIDSAGNITLTTTGPTDTNMLRAKYVANNATVSETIIGQGLYQQRVKSMLTSLAEALLHTITTATNQ